VNEILGSLRLEKHPDKTFSGRIERGFDFLGYHFTADSLTLAGGTLANFIDRATRLYEQERVRPKDPSPLWAYVKRWCSWGERRIRRACSGPRNPPGRSAQARRIARRANRKRPRAPPSRVRLAGSGVFVGRLIR